MRQRRGQVDDLEVPQLEAVENDDALRNAELLDHPPDEPGDVRTKGQDQGMASGGPAGQRAGRTLRDRVEVSERRLEVHVEDQDQLSLITIRGVARQGMSDRRPD